MTIDEWRIIPTPGIYNFRDYGGYALSGGGHLRRGVLFRSGQHGDASDADLVLVHNLGLSDVIDFRGATERAMNPCRRHPDFAARLTFTAGETVNPARIEAMTGSGQHVLPQTRADGIAAMRHVYAEMPSEPAIVDLFRRYFAVLAAADGPSLVHCMAGKDRTGFAVYMLHHLLGVHPDDRLQDYLATNHMPWRREWIERSTAFAARIGTLPPPDALDGMMSVHLDLLKGALETVDREYGDLDAYMQNVLGVDASMREALRNRLTE